MTHAASGQGALVPFRPGLPVPPRPAPRDGTAHPFPALRRVSVVRAGTAGPLLGASALAVAAVVGGLLRRLATAGRPPRSGPPRPARSAPGVGATVRVTWTAVEIRWTDR
jgi:hypothetical protein